MRYRLVCQDDPVALGIENERGEWSIEKLKKHCEDCIYCNHFAMLIKAEMLSSLTKALSIEKEVTK